MQHQLILQQPNGPTWLRVCAKLNHFPSLQQVHQYDSALKLVTDNGHEATEEIYSCIVSEHQKLAKERAEKQLMERAHRSALAMSRAATASSLVSAFQMARATVQQPQAPIFNPNFGQRQYLVCLELVHHRMRADRCVFRTGLSTQVNSRRVSSMVLARSTLLSAATIVDNGSWRAFRRCSLRALLIVRRAFDKKHGRGVMLYAASGKSNNGEYSW